MPVCLVSMASAHEAGTEFSPLVHMDHLPRAVDISAYSTAPLVGLESVSNEMLWFRL